MLNLSPLFFTTDSDESCLLSELNLGPKEQDYISKAKTAIRNCLRFGIPQVLRTKGYTGNTPQPRFFTQGSWAYKTLNAPAQRPQQADIDDGCYMPISFVSQTARPSTAASIFFAAAEEALTPLVEAEGWKLSTDKPTCIRIIITPHAHIDVPLYAIPDAEFETLTKAAFDRGYMNYSEALMKAERDAWVALPRNSVLLAHREHNWIESDPRPFKDWFLDQVSINGEQLRRVVRYIKAFRDWKWPSGGPTSILLMAAVAPIFEKHDRRDDLALLDVIAALPTKLRSGVNNPADTTESLTKRLGAEGVEAAARQFDALEKLLRGAIDSGNEAQACAWMRNAFGPRFPNEPDRIKVVSVAATIATSPHTVASTGFVPRSPHLSHADRKR